MFFALCDESDKYLSADVDVDIRIIDDTNSSYDIISYKLYDNNGYVADTGNIYLSSLSNGDKFKNEAITYYDAVPGETYTLRFFEYSW